MKSGFTLIKSFVILLLLLASAAWSQTPASPASEFVIHNVRIFDGSRVIKKGDVWVRNGLIQAVGAKVKAPSGARLIDGTGKTLLPGLIDAHVHTWGDAPRQALIFGVTTELDMFSDYKYAAKIKKDQAEGKDLDFAKGSRKDLEGWSGGALE